jgi:hypothetical protein
MKFTVCRLRQAVLLAALALATPALSEDFDNGSFYLPICKSYLEDEGDRKTPPTWNVPCSEVVGTILFFTTALKPEYAICDPKGVSTHQAMRVVVKYLESNPERLHEPFPHLAHEALQTASPCSLKEFAAE